MANTSDHDKRSVSYWWAAPAILLIAASVAIGIWQYPHVPSRFAIHFDLQGNPNRWTDKSIASVFSLPILEVLLTILMGFLHHWIGRSAVDIDPANPEGLAQRQKALQRRLTQGLWMMMAFMNVGLFSLNLIVLGLWKQSGALAGLATTLPILVGVIILIVISFQASRVGRRSQTSPSQSSYVHRDDDRYWLAGGIYYNRDDPAWMVPKRFGVGWTCNFAHPGSWLLILAIIGLVTAVGFIPAMVGH